MSLTDSVKPLGYGKANNAKERQAQMPRKVIHSMPPPPLIHCADKPNAAIEVARICRARWRSTEVR